MQIARLLGLRVIGTASTREKCSRVLELGAEHAVTYNAFETAVRESTGGQGPDIILDTLGGEVLRRDLSLLPPLGRLVILGLASRQAPAIDPVKPVSVASGARISSQRRGSQRAALVQESVGKLLVWIGEGKLRIQIGHTFPLLEIRRAHELLASRDSYGKSYCSNDTQGDYNPCLALSIWLTYDWVLSTGITTRWRP